VIASVGLEEDVFYKKDQDKEKIRNNLLKRS
jgi:hypothetical protein